MVPVDVSTLASPLKLKGMIRPGHLLRSAFPVIVPPCIDTYRMAPLAGATVKNKTTHATKKRYTFDEFKILPPFGSQAEVVSRVPQHYCNPEYTSSWDWTGTRFRDTSSLQDYTS